MKKVEYTDSISKADVKIITCLPVRLVPDLPDREPTLIYSTMTCKCGEKYWIGTRQQKLAKEHDDMRVLCALCVLKEYGVGPLINIVTLANLKP